MQKILYILTALLLSASLEAKDQISRVLFVGNSYTGQVRGTFLSMIKDAGADQIYFEFITPGVVLSPGISKTKKR